MMQANLRTLGFTAVFLVLASVSVQAKEVRIASHVSETSPLYATADMFAERIGKKFPDEFEFKFYPNGQLGKESALLDNLKLGSLEMAMVASGVLKLDNKLGVFDLPWLFSDRDHVKHAINGPFGKAVKDRIESEQGFVVLGIFENGFRHVVNTKRAITKPEDMDGLKIRVTGSKFKRDGFSAIGADPVPVAWQETFTAIQQGVVDGAEAALYGFYGAKLYEITKYLSLTTHTYSPSFLLVSRQFWDSLDEKQQATFRKVAADMVSDAYQKAAELEQGYVEKMKDHITINEVDLKPFQEKAASVYEGYVKKYGAEWVEMVRKAQ